MERKLNYEVFSEDGVFVTRYLEVEVASDGPTENEAVANLQEALKLCFAPLPPWPVRTIGL